MIPAAFTFFGALLGMSGASSLFWFRKNQKKALLEATTPSGETVGDQIESWSNATFALRKRNDWRDGLTFAGWCFVIVGAVFAFFDL